MKIVEEKINDTIFNRIKKSNLTWYHATTNVDINKDNYLEKILIFDSLDDYANYERVNDCYVYDKLGRKRFYESRGRINLDAAFHGFYLTCSRKRAEEWARAQARKDKSVNILSFSINKEMFEMKPNKILCFPNDEWFEFMCHNFDRKTDKNELLFSYTLMLDGEKDRVIDYVSNGMLDDAYNEAIHGNLRKYQLDNHEWNYDSFQSSIDISTGYLLQLCISSQKLIKYLKFVDCKTIL